MPLATHQAFLVIGGFFLLLGIVFVIWNRREKTRYYDSILLTRKDVRESLTHEPERVWLHAWRIGGWICIILGVVLLIIGGVLRFIGS